jgi:hypothetical protein
MGKIGLTMTDNQDLRERILDSFNAGKVMEKHFPMLLREGIPDFGVNVHSHFLTFLATTGQSLGFAAIS